MHRFHGKSAYYERIWWIQIAICISLQTIVFIVAKSLTHRKLKRVKSACSRGNFAWIRFTIPWYNFTKNSWKSMLSWNAIWNEFALLRGYSSTLRIIQTMKRMNLCIKQQRFLLLIHAEVNVFFSIFVSRNTRAVEIFELMKIYFQLIIWNCCNA